MLGKYFVLCKLRHILRYSYLQFLVFPSLKQEFCMVIFENRILYWNLNKVIAAINSKDCNMVMGHVKWQCLKLYKIFSLNDLFQMFLPYLEFRFYVFFFHWIHMQKQCYKWQFELRYQFKLSIPVYVYQILRFLSCPIFTMLP